IVPCGDTEHAVTSIASITGDSPSVASVARSTLSAFSAVFDADLAWNDVASVPELGVGTFARDTVVHAAHPA
ncbi:MAG TPA: hypothetical protein VGL13_13665, partial [Polyangiaceae bacterium]